MNTAHRFQEKYTGVQILVWHSTKQQSIDNLFQVVINPENWIYLDEVTINTVK